MRSDHAQRVLIYSHDTYGLGHLRRSTAIAERLVADDPARAVVVVTGSPRARAFPLPPGCDTIKLPSVLKQPDGRYLPRTLPIPLEDLIDVRASVIDAAARAFDPDLVLVDHAPAGLKGELRPLLDRLRGAPRRPTLVLGLRDVIDAAPAVRAEWQALGVPDLIEHDYDEILVYGDARLPTTAMDLGLERSAPGRVHHVGYLSRSPVPSIRSASLGPEPYVLVTAGGGGDGRDVLLSYARYLESRAGNVPFRSIVVTGPFLSDARAREVRARLLDAAPGVEVIEFTTDLETLVHKASAVIAMAGYNTVVEVVAARVPVLFVPRSGPRAEQIMRCERLARLSDIQWCMAADATPARLGAFLDGAIGRERPGAPRVDLDGLERTTRFLGALLEKKRGPRARTAV